MSSYSREYYYPQVREATSNPGYEATHIKWLQDTIDTIDGGEGVPIGLRQAAEQRMHELVLVTSPTYARFVLEQ